MKNLTILYIALLGVSVVFDQRQRLSVTKKENYRKKRVIFYKKIKD